MKQAKFGCVLCGVSAGEKALEVDHIIPQNLGGGSRLQDSTRGFLFCELARPKIEAQNELAMAIRDGFLLTALHT